MSMLNKSLVRVTIWLPTHIIQGTICNLILLQLSLHLFLLLSPYYHQHLGKEYDLIEQLKDTHANISLWDLIETKSTHQGILQYVLNNIDA